MAEINISPRNQGKTDEDKLDISRNQVGGKIPNKEAKKQVKISFVGIVIAFLLFLLLVVFLVLLRRVL